MHVNPRDHAGQARADYAAESCILAPIRAVFDRSVSVSQLNLAPDIQCWQARNFTRWCHNEKQQQYKTRMTRGLNLFFLCGFALACSMVSCHNNHLSVCQCLTRRHSHSTACTHVGGSNGAFLKQVPVDIFLMPDGR